MHNMNSLVFPDPDRFQPERWLNDAPKLEQYLCSFSRGSRGCLGMKYVDPKNHTLLGIFLVRPPTLVAS